MVAKMLYTMIEYRTMRKVATITLNRPDKQNALLPEMWDELEAALGEANRDPEVRVIILCGAGDSFCAGLDLPGVITHYGGVMEYGYDPGRHAMMQANSFLGPVPKYMQVWRGLKPVIAKVHGWCIGSGSELALCADLVVASEDAQFGTPYSRVWGCHLTGMWIYRLGLTRAKYYALTGKSVSGKEAVDIGLINFAYPLEELDREVQTLAESLATIPASQLGSMKLVVNQAFESMGLHSTQYLGPILDSLMRNTPEGRAFSRTTEERSIGAAVAERDAPFGDYSQAPEHLRPRQRSKL